MSKRQLDDWLDSFLRWTENSESASTFRLWTGISCVAAALQRKCWVQWGALTFYPNMYIILVGPSGSRKGTAMGPGNALLTDIGIKLAAQSTTRQALIRRLKNSTYNHVDPISKEVSFHSSLTVFSEEFTVFLGYQNRELMADLCDWYDCKRVWTYETKNMGTDEVVGVWVNLIGATTPSLIRSSLPQDSIGGGLTSRMIFVYEEGKEKTVLMPAVDPHLGQQLRNDLERIHLMAGRFSVTEGFFSAWSDWYSKAHLNPPFKDEKFEGYIDRRPTHLMKLSMIVSAAAGDTMIVTENDFYRALHILEVTERKMPQTFGGYGLSQISGILHRVLAWLATNREVTEADLMQRFYQDADKFTMSKVIETLESMDAIKLVHTAAGRIIKFVRNVQ